MHVESWIDQVDVFEEASLVICHAGSGTTFGVLSSGVPLALLPMFADHSTNTQLVQRAGAGIVVTEGKLSADANVDQIKAQTTPLRNAVIEILGNASYRESAASMGEEINNHDSPTTLVDRLTEGASAPTFLRTSRDDAICYVGATQSQIASPNPKRAARTRSTLPGTRLASEGPRKLPTNSPPPRARAAAT